MKYLILALFSLITFHSSAQNQDLPIGELVSELYYRNIGPNRGGRVTAVAGVTSRPEEFYMGATGGGVWKTTDYGVSWKNVSDGYFATGSIGAIRVSETNPDIVYVGTGSDGIRSNVIIGKGMYKSIDAGSSWEFIGLEDAGQIGAVLISPDNPDICYVAAIGNPFGFNDMRGVFKTTDGGKTWDKQLFISNKTGAVDLEMSPDNHDIIYASVWTVERKPWTIISGSDEGGVYKSINGGKAWSRLNSGLPQGIIGKSDLAVCNTNPSFLYVLMEAAEGQNGLYFSEDYGENFKLISDYKYLLDRPFYYCNIDVDPNNPDVIYVNTTGLHKSIDKGENWDRMSTPHGDNHDMWINPNDSELFIQSNDGGANISQDGGKSWSPQENQPTAELYQVNIDDQYPYWLYAGQQDNSTLAMPSTNTFGSRRRGVSFISVGGCETGPAVPKPGNHNIVYSNCKGRFGTYNKLTGTEKQYYVGAANMYGHNPADLKYRFQRVAPIYVSPHNPDVVYHASQFLHKTTDDGANWQTISPDLTAFEPDKQVVSGSPITRDITGEEFYSTIYSINESPIKEGVIWIGANDGPVHVTTDGGESWNNVTPPDLPPGGRVQTVEASPHNPAKAYFAVYRFMLNDFKPYIYRTSNYGKTWTKLSTNESGFPDDFPTRVIREDPSREGLLFAGTEFGMFVSFDDGLNWEEFQQNLPVVPITDIKIYNNDLVLSTMGRGFWIMDNISPLLEASNQELTDIQLFSPKDAIRSGISKGLSIDYYLPEELEDIEISILDKTGKLVKKIQSSGDKGFHRLSWNLTSATEASPSVSSRRRSSGPKVVPDNYVVSLKSGNKTLKKNFSVLRDPRIPESEMSNEDYKAQYDLRIKVGQLRTDAGSFQKELITLIEKLDGKKRHSKKLDSLKEIKAKIVTDSGPYPQPMLSGQISYLYSMISRVDQKPGNQASIRYTELQEQLEGLKQKYKDLK